MSSTLISKKTKEKLKTKLLLEIMNDIITEFPNLMIFYNES